MKADESETAIRSLLDTLGRTFNLERSFGDRPLGTHLEEIIREAAATEIVEVGVPGDAAELRRSSEGAMNFFYRPHLFPGMDPALHLGHVVQYNLLPVGCLWIRPSRRWRCSSRTVISRATCSDGDPTTVF